MPSNQKRHTCVVCGVKRVESLMIPIMYRRLGLLKWRCDSFKLNKKKGVSNNCSEWTP